MRSACIPGLSFFGGWLKELELINLQKPLSPFCRSIFPDKEFFLQP
jgi:hypothetical protein